VFSYIHTMFTIEFVKPYTQGVTQQSFRSRSEAENMIAFYATCGVRAHFV